MNNLCKNLKRNSKKIISSLYSLISRSFQAWKQKFLFILDDYLVKIKIILWNRKGFSYLFQLSFSLLILIHGMSMFADFIENKYRYKLEIYDNSIGFEFPPISLCTEPMVLFDRHKVFQYLDLFEDYSNYLEYIESQTSLVRNGFTNLSAFFQICMSNITKITNINLLISNSLLR